MKLLVVCCLLVVALVGFTNAQTHDASWGKHVKGNIYLGNQTVMAYPSSKIQKEQVEFTTKGTKIRFTYIQAIDLITDNKGGYVNLLTGGIGKQNVKFEFKSQAKKGYNFLLLFWGK